MHKLVSFVRSTPLRVSALVAVATATIAIPAVLHAWGPVRETYTIANPADHITFNSITDNPNLGDERNFTSVREVGSTGNWQDAVTVQPGKEYEVRVYVHNNAADNLNLVAKDVTVKANVPTTTGKSVRIMGWVTSSNATPTEVYDQADLNSTENFNVAYVAGSAKYYNNVFGKYGTGTGVALPDSIVTSAGAKVGYDKLDGNVPGCFKYAGVAVFRVKPQFAATHNFTMEKLVSKHGANKWVDSYAAQPGETVDYLLEYKNTGNSQQDNVTFRDKLPANMTYVPGSAKFGNSKNPGGVQASDNVTGVGVNIGSYAPGANAWFIFSAKVAAKENLPCGPATLHNVASVTPGGQNPKEDSADVTTTKECVNPKDITVCRLSDKKIVTIKDTEFDSTKYSKNLDDCKSVVEKVEACNIKTRKIELVEKSKIDNINYTLDFDKCRTIEDKTIEVCRLSDKKYPVTIKESDFDSTKYSKNPEDCKSKPVVKTIEVCRLSDKEYPVTIKENEFDASKYSKDASDCEETPAETPAELPHTGIAEGISGIFGLGALVAAGHYYAASRRAL